MAIGKYKEWLTPEGLATIEGYARDGLNDNEIAKKLHITPSTFYEWLKNFSEIKETIKKARVPVNEIVEKTFFDTKLKPQTVVETITEKTIHRDAEGNIKSSTEHVKKQERYIPADTTAMLFYMKCRMPEKYNDRINVSIDNGKELPKLYEALEADDDIREVVEEAETDI